jgi:glutathione S-transferase
VRRQGTIPRHRKPPLCRSPLEVDPKPKRTREGADYRDVYPLGLVPALRLDDGSLLTENDAYLFTVLNWTVPTAVDLTPWPAIKAFHERLKTRASVAKALHEELALYKAELARQRAA